MLEFDENGSKIYNEFYSGIKTRSRFCIDLSQQCRIDFAQRYSRKRHPEKAEKNRILQRVRNTRRNLKKEKCAGHDPALIAKVDASKSKNISMDGQFWLVPVIAKVDALKLILLKLQALTDDCKEGLVRYRRSFMVG